MDVSTCVVTLPQQPRLDRARRLASAFHGRVQVDPGVGMLENHRRAWGQTRGHAWGLVLQDDIVLASPRTPAVIVQRLAEADTLGYPVVTFYSAQRRARQAWQAGQRWARLPAADFFNEQALAMNRDTIAAYLDAFPRLSGRPRSSRIDHDRLLAALFQELKVAVAICVPNPINHDVTLKSTLGHPAKVGGRLRQSSTFGLGQEG